MAQTQFKTGKGICPATGSKGNWSYTGNLHNPSFIISYCGGAALPGWFAVGEATTGGAMFRREQSDLGDRSDEITLEHWSSFGGETRSAQEEGKAEPAILHLVYGLLLRYCLLTESHRAMLQERGMPLAALTKRLQMGSLPAPKLRPQIAQKIYEESGLSRDQLLQVPGFFINRRGHLSIAGRQGLLLATLDAKRRIIGFQIRSDNKQCKQRYTWLSSGNKEGGTGSGAPASFLGDPRAKVAALTEGAFKIAALDFAGLATASVSIAGVGNVAAAMERLEELPHLEELHIYYDADWSEKPQVLKALSRMIKAAMLRGLRVRAWGWKASWGKGIDDALMTGMPNEELFEIPIDGLLRCISPFKSHPRLKTDVMPRWSKADQAAPDQAFFRQQTYEKMRESFARPVGTLISIGAPTNSGKTYSTNRLVPKNNIRVFRDYAALEESEAELCQLYGEDSVNVLYGRISRPNDPNDEAARRRYEKAGCPNYGQMKERAEKGQWACSGCPLAPDHKEPGKETCAYWRHRRTLFEAPPEHLLCVIQAFTHNGELLEHLPRDKNHELFEEKYETLVIDDSPHFDAYLSHEKAIKPADVEIWRKHPELDPSDPEHQDLCAWLDGLQALLQGNSDNDKELKDLRKRSKEISKFASYPCEEEAFEYDLPLRAIKGLSTWLARGGAIRFEECHSSSKKNEPYQCSLPTKDQRKEGKGEPQKQGKGPHQGRARTLFYLDPPKKLLERLKYMRIIHLDATPDESKLSWLADALGMTFEAPEFVRRTPKIIQVGDLLWDRGQLISNKELVKELIHHIQGQGGVALGFKHLDDPELNELFDGHWGRDERGLNVFQGAKGVGLFGHYALPVEEARHMAFRQRALGWHLKADSPDARLSRELSEERTFSDPWRPWVRKMHCEEDPLVEHHRRHHYTSSVIQGADRDRATETTAFLLSGEPLDGLSWDVPVELITRQELRQRLGISAPEEEIRQINQGLKRHNEIKQEEAKERIEAMMPSIRQWVEELGELPGVRRIIRYLNDAEKKGGQAIAYKILDQLKIELDMGHLVLPKNTEQMVEINDNYDDGKKVAIEPLDKSIENQNSTIMTDGYIEYEDSGKTIERGVSNIALKELTIGRLSDTPSSILSLDTEHSPPSFWLDDSSWGVGLSPSAPFVDSDLLNSDLHSSDLHSSDLLNSDLLNSDHLERDFVGWLHSEAGSISRHGPRVEVRPDVGSGCVVTLMRTTEYRGDYDPPPEASCWPLDDDGIEQVERLGEEYQFALVKVFDGLIERGHRWQQALRGCLVWLVQRGYQLSEEAFWSMLWWRKGLTTGLMIPWERRAIVDGYG